MLNKWILTFLLLGTITTAVLAAFPFLNQVRAARLSQRIKAQQMQAKRIYAQRALEQRIYAKRVQEQAQRLHARRMLEQRNLTQRKMWLAREKKARERKARERKAQEMRAKQSAKNRQLPRYVPRRDGKSLIGTRRPAPNANPSTKQNSRNHGQDLQTTIDLMNNVLSAPLLSTPHPPQIQTPQRLEGESNWRPEPWKGKGSFTGDLKLHCLQNGNNRPCSNGIVQMYNNELRQWGTICGDSWSHRYAEVVCKYLGFRTGEARYIIPWPQQPFAISGLYMFMNNVDCKGGEWALTDCIGGAFTLYSKCPRNRLAVVQCIGELPKRHPWPCPYTTTQCYYGDRCLHRNRFGDGISDCPWGTDEI